MKNKLISIIVPMYNSSSTIERCLNSLKNQSYKNIEIIVINDGSTDNSSEICRKMIKKDKRIKIYEKVNQGVSSARNLGLSHAKGDFIGFVDSDDYIEEKMYEELLEMIMKTKAKMAICNLYFENNKESEILKFKYKDIIFD